MSKNVFILIAIACLFATVNGQTNSYYITTVGFYNLENLFDCEDDPLTYDEDYTPTGRNQWTEAKLAHKLTNLATVISKIGKDKTKKAPVLLGVAEVENRKVLELLVDHPLLKECDYGIAHANSPDIRGIDVGLLYDRKAFTFTHLQKHRLWLTDEMGKSIYSRDQLVVSGYLGEELLFCIVNHWPSRRGGQKRSNSKRLEAAKLTKRITDSIYKIEENAAIIVMGDFNDDPTNNSFKKILHTKSKKQLNSEVHYLYNPMEAMHLKGIGSLAYRDKWNLFDQVLVSNTLLDTIGLRLYTSHVYAPNYIIDTKGKYKGYPLRTFSSRIYTGGYSDHFPVYIHLIKKIDSSNSVE